MPVTRYSFHRICEAACGLKITVEDNRVTKIEPDQEHVVSKGYGDSLLKRGFMKRPRKGPENANKEGSTPSCWPSNWVSPSHWRGGSRQILPANMQVSPD